MEKKSKHESVPNGHRSTQNRAFLESVSTPESRAKGMYVCHHVLGHHNERPHPLCPRCFPVEIQSDLVAARRTARDAQCASIASLGGNKSMEAKVGIHSPKLNNRMGTCRRWNINRGKPCVCGQHQQNA